MNLSNNKKIEFEQIFTQHKEQIIRMLKYMGLSDAMCADISQETFIELLKEMAKDVKIDYPLAWLKRVSRNKAINHFKSGVMKYEDSNTEILDFEPSKELVGNDVLIQDCVNGKILQFKEKHPARANAIQEQLDGVSIKEIAQSIGRTDSATREYLSQSKKKIAEFLVDCKELLEKQPKSLKKGQA